MIPELKINQEIIKLVNPMLFVRGEFDIASISTGTSKMINWRDLISEIFEQPEKMNEFIHQLPQRLSAVNNLQSSNMPSTAQAWSDLMQSYHQLEKIKGAFPNLLRISRILKEKSTISQDIIQLEEFRLKLQKITQNSLYDTKNNLIHRLRDDLASLLPEFELERDQYLVYENKMQGFLKNKGDYDQSQKQFKEEQRILFRQTNELTKLMDERDPQMQIYSDKLADLDSESQSEDYHRIKGKYDVVKAEYDKLKAHRDVIMKESKALKQKTLKLRNQFKQSNKNLRVFQPQFHEAESKFKYLEAKVDSLHKQIKETESELSAMADGGSSTSSSQTMSTDSLPYSSVDQVDEIILQKKLRQDNIHTKLQELFHTIDSSEISRNIEGRIEDMKDRMEDIGSQFENYERSVSSGFSFQTYIETVKNLQETVGSFLQPVGMEMVFMHTVKGPSNELFKINISLKNNKGSEMKLEDLKRVEKAYVILSFIVSCYLIAGLNIIPIELNSLPASIITKQTFLNATQLLAEKISSMQPKESIYIVFFMGETIFNVSPEVILNQ